MRPVLKPQGFVPARSLMELPEHKRVKLAGLVLVRQRPGTASGVIFVTIEDETGIANLIVWPKVMERYRRTLLGARLLGVEGKLQREGIVIHVIAEKLTDHSAMLSTLGDLPDPELFDQATSPASLPPPLRPINEVQIVLPEARNFR